MNDLRNEKIKRLERRLLKVNRIGDEELRKIVSAPQLFDKINARIKLSQEDGQTPPAAFREPEKLPFWRLPKFAPAFGGLLVFLACALGLIFLTRAEFSVSKLTESVTAPAIGNDTAFVENEEINEPGKAEDSVVENRDSAKKIAFKNKSSKAERRASGLSKARKSVLPAVNEAEEAFYPLAFAENLEEAKKAGQVIRVELSRSSLLALGMNPPTTDENLKIKTDLLIGTDGVAQGIRFVK